MKYYTAFLIVIAALIIFFNEPEISEPTQNSTITRQQETIAKARMICAAAQNTNEGVNLKIICGVDEENSTINIRINMPIADPRQICRGMALEARKNGIILGEEWKIIMLPPMNSGSKEPTAACPI